MLFRRMLEITPVGIILVSRQTRRVVYLNNQAVELFGEEGTELIGTHVNEFFVHQEGIDFFRKELYESMKVRKAETQLIRKDGTTFIGLITAVHSIFHEEEVALSCIVDLTDQKRVEEALKRNNEYIKELNAELMVLNKDLMTKSIKDGLTNLYNHQYIYEILERVLQETAVSQEPFCVMMMDIDHFKKSE